MGILWHECEILPKNCRVAPSPLDTQTAPCDTWHRSFHPDISHPEFFPADIPSGYLTSRILLRRHSTRVSHIWNSSPTRTSHIRNPVRQRSTFSGYLTSRILSCRRSTFSGYLASGILSGRRSTFFFILRAFS